MENLQSVTTRAISDAILLRGPAGGGEFRMVTTEPAHLLRGERRRLAEAALKQLPADADRPTTELVRQLAPLIQAALAD